MLVNVIGILEKTILKYEDQKQPSRIQKRKKKISHLVVVILNRALPLPSPSFLSFLCVACILTLDFLIFFFILESVK
jgi:hypothetical protein